MLSFLGFTTKIAIIGLASGSMVLLILICIFKIGCKYQLSRRNNNPMIMADPRILIREGIIQSEHVEMHEYEEIIEDIVSQVSSIYSGQDKSGNESSNESNVKCGTDSDGYLQPCH